MLSPFNQARKLCGISALPGSAAQFNIPAPVAFKIPVVPADIADVRRDGQPHLLAIEPASFMDPAVVKADPAAALSDGGFSKLLLLLRRVNFFLERVAIGESHEDGMLVFFSGVPGLTAFIDAIGGDE